MKLDSYHERYVLTGKIAGYGTFMIVQGAMQSLFWATRLEPHWSYGVVAGANVAIGIAMRWSARGLLRKSQAKDGDWFEVQSKILDAYGNITRADVAARLREWIHHGKDESELELVIECLEQERRGSVPLGGGDA